MSDDLVKLLRRPYGNLTFAEKKETADRLDRIEDLEAERDESWRRAAYAEEQWGRCEAKLAKAVEALELADKAIMETVNDLDLAGVASFFIHLRTIRTILAELKEEK